MVFADADNDSLENLHAKMYTMYNALMGLVSTVPYINSGLVRWVILKSIRQHIQIKMFLDQAL